MTEGKGKRRYRRRGPRKRKAGAEGEGAPAAERPQGAEGLEGAPAEDRAPEWGEDPGAAAGETAGETAGYTGETLSAGESVAGAAPKKGRRRSRRRGKRGKGAIPGGETETAGPRGETPPPTGADVSLLEPAVAEPLGAGSTPPQEDEAAVETVAPGVPGEPGKTGRRRRRRRRRRRGKGQAEGADQPAIAQGGPEEGDQEGEGEEFEEFEPAGEPLHTAGGTDAGEGEPAAEEEAEEEEAEPEEGTGARKVMLIDGLQSEENRVAIVSDGVLDYYEVENQRRKAFKGNIYKAKVVNIAHAIEAAFVDFGGGRHGFLPLNEYCAGALMDHLGDWNEGDKRPPLRPGMEILVQVTKEESAIKGAAVTSYISIAGRYMVMMLGMKRYGISKKITGEKERERIRKHMEKLEYPDHLGFIVRTVGAARPLKDLKSDLQNLLKLWDRTVAGARGNKAPSLLYEEQDIVIRTLRDNYTADVTEVLMNSEDAYRKASSFFDVYYPKQKGKLKLYRQKRPLFAKFNLEEQVERASARKVPLPSGGHIVFDRSEALWSIDVNSGRSSKDRDIEDTAFRTNKEAAAEVTRQLRLRDIGGLIVVDFIDMESKGHNKDVEKILKDGLKRDKAKSDVTSLGKFGLVAISRQRMGTSYYDVLTRGCELCGGTGVTLTQDANVVRLLRRLHDELSREGREPGKEVTVRVAPGLLETLLNQKRDDIGKLERLCGGKVAFHADPALPNGSYSIGNGAAQ
jgi:ribonuclease E